MAKLLVVVLSTIHQFFSLFDVAVLVDVLGPDLGVE